MQARRAIDNPTVDSCVRITAHSPTLAVLLSAAVVVSLTTPAAAQVPSPQPATFLGNGNYYCGGLIALPTLSGPGTSPPESCIVAGVTTAQPSITLAGSPGALASTSASALTTSSVNGSVDTAAQIDYYVVITGGPSVSPVPVTVDLSAYLSASSSGNAAGGASLEIAEVSSPGTVVGTWNVCADTQGFPFGGCGELPTTIALQTTVTMSSNTLYVVVLMAGAEVPGPFGSIYGTGTSSGFVDPSFGIDSMTPDASDYSLNFSAGIGNSTGPPNPVTPVPEPGSLAVLGAALIGLSAIRRRKRP